jgi:hypothetical protein
VLSAPGVLTEGRTTWCSWNAGSRGEQCGRGLPRRCLERRQSDSLGASRGTDVLRPALWFGPARNDSFPLTLDALAWAEPSRGRRGWLKRSLKSPRPRSDLPRLPTIPSPRCLTNVETTPPPPAPQSTGCERSLFHDWRVIGLSGFKNSAVPCCVPPLGVVLDSLRTLLRPP